MRKWKTCIIHAFPVIIQNDTGDSKKQFSNFLYNTCTNKTTQQEYSWALIPEK